METFDLLSPLLFFSFSSFLFFFFFLFLVLFLFTNSFDIGEKATERKKKKEEEEEEEEDRIFGMERARGVENRANESRSRPKAGVEDRGFQGFVFKGTTDLLYYRGRPSCL